MFQRMHHHLLGLFYPNLCGVCNENLESEEEHLCSSCLCSLPKTNFHLSPNNLMEQRLWGKVNFHRATAFFHFQKGSPLQKILYSLKYKGDKEIGEYLGKLAATDLIQSADFQSIDCILPVPLHPNRLKTRGYNQSECIAKGISTIINQPLDNSNLKRITDTRSQTRKNVYDRYVNTEGIFELDSNSNLKNKHVLLVDDVMTTGSTIESCIHTLNRVEGITVSIFTLAIAN